MSRFSLMLIRVLIIVLGAYGVLFYNVLYDLKLSKIVSIGLYISVLSLSLVAKPAERNHKY